jgi:hypothetical protein
MTHIQQDGPDLRQKLDALRIKRPTSERKLRANRANAQRSTGPRTAAGKAVSSRNACKHGILSRTVDFAAATSAMGTASCRPCGSPGPAVFVPGSLLGKIVGVRCKLEKVLIFENECAQQPNGLDQNARLICRYETMLTTKLHTYIREYACLQDG